MSDVGGRDTTTTTNNNRSVVRDSADVQQSATTPRHQSFVHNTVHEHNDNVQLNTGSRDDLNEDAPLPLKDTNINVNDNTNIENSNENPFAPRTLPINHQREQEGQCNPRERNPFSLDMRPQPDQGNSMEPNLNLTSKELQGGEATLTMNEYNVLEGRRIPQDDSGVAILHIQTINETKPRKSRRQSVEFSTHESDNGSKVRKTQNSHHKRRRYSGASEDSQNSSILSSSSFKKRTCSLRCWVLLPLVLILLVVATVTVTVTTLLLINSNQRAFRSLQATVVSIIESYVGRLTFSKMVNMAQGTGRMYFLNNTFVNPLTDQLMPIENGMMSHLCAVLRDVDSERVVYSMIAVSLTRQQAAVCAYSRIRPGSYVGTTSQNGFIDDFYYVDPLTLEYKIPLEPYGLLTEPMTVEQFTSIQGYYPVINIWNESIQKGKVPNASQYWVTPSNPPTFEEYVFPFLEQYEDGTTGVGYLAVSMFTDNLKSMQLYNASETGIRVMLVEPNARAERFLVFGNNWGQPLSNVTNVWFSSLRGDPIRFMYTDDVTDPVVREGLKHINLRDVMGVGREVERGFMYGGFDARITAKYLVTESGVELVIVVVTDRSYYMGAVMFQRDLTFVAEAIMLVLVTALCVTFVECCMVRPLRVNRSKLKMALSGTSVAPAKHRGVALREVRELEEVCDTLRRRLDNIRTYMPDRVLAEAEGVMSQASLRYGFGSAPLRAQSSDELRQVMCSIAYVYYTPRRSRNPSDVEVEMMMQMVVCASSECGGCLEVQRPDYCVVSFGVQGRGGELAAEASRAVEFARRLRVELTECAELDGVYRVIVESGTFLSGVISGGGRSHFVLLGRNLHRRVGGFLPQAGVVSAVTEETALLVRGRFRLLPFETVYLDDDDAYVKLHEVLDGDVGTAAWADYERCYGEAYDGMVRGDYQTALFCWDRARAVEQSSLAGEAPSCRSSQSERLRAECAARVAQGDSASYARRPNPARMGQDEVANSSDAASRSETNSIDLSSQTHSCRTGTMTLQTADTLSRDDAAGSLPRHFKDHLGNTWTRSFEPVDDAAADITPVYMAISATGTLAVLKVCPLTEAASRLPRAELDTALRELLSLEMNDSLVQYLSYCHAPPHGVVLVTEYVPGGTLLDMKTRYGRKLPLMAVKRNVVSVLRALVFLHGRGLVHGRVCPENVMVGVEGRCRLKGMLLTAEPLLVHHDSYYVSPEEAAGAAKTAAGDMYALGLLLLEMLTDTHPWQWTAQVSLERSRNELDSLLTNIALFREAVRDGLVEPVAPPADLDDKMRGVLEACLCVAPEQRLSAEAVLSKFNV